MLVCKKNGQERKSNLKSAVARRVMKMQLERN
jgi:hypothetical protein